MEFYCITKDYCKEFCRTTKKTDTDTTTMDTESVFDDQTTEVSHVAKDMINQNENQD